MGPFSFLRARLGPKTGATMAWYCDTSAIDWDAVGALGTWFVGAAAIFVAIRANALTKAIQQGERRRSSAAARNAAISMQMELEEYALLSARIADELCFVIGDDTPPESLRDAKRVFDRIPFPELPPLGDRATSLAEIPEATSGAIFACYSAAPTWRRSVDQLLSLIDRTLEIDPNPGLHAQMAMRVQEYAKELKATVETARRVKHLLEEDS